MNTEGITSQMSNYAEFKSAVGRYGFSINNFYDVKFELTPASPLFSEIKAALDIDVNDATNLMRLYTDETSVPGIQMSTGDYRITNTPNLKYVYGGVFSEASFSFIMDADSRIRSLFDVWTNWMYGYSSRLKRSSEADFPFIQTSPKMRTAYRDDYSVDIVITKYERSMSSHLNKPGDNAPAFSIKDIIPDSRRAGGTKFYKAIPVYATRLFNAFPSNVASIPLNSSASELSKLSVSFEYETLTTTALNQGKIAGSITDPINSGDGLDLFFNFI